MVLHKSIQVAGSDLNGFSTLSQRVLRPLMSQVESGKPAHPDVAYQQALAPLKQGNVHLHTRRYQEVTIDELSGAAGEAVAEAVALSSLLAIFRGAAEGDASWRSLQSQAAEQLSSAGGTVLQQLIQKRPDGQQYW